MQELQAVAQTSRALRAAARALPAAVWRQSTALTVPSYHPLSSAADVPAAADRLWRGCAGLVHGVIAAGSTDTKNELTATLLQVQAHSLPRSNVLRLLIKPAEL